ncbi:MAG TPA: RNA-directed DNA polymerase [Longimicrobium sp.]|jgi:hypothetical protein|uniref:RNA-directed DNA polymerase n=1 Tax=Longimicrobium sp. TaxID=2029185 RepID=UPI002ED8ED30
MDTNRTAERGRDLDNTFSVPVMRTIWKRIVRNQLRGQTAADLHDYLEVHRALTPFLQRLRASVISGYYRPSPAQIIRLEKRDGIPRRIPLPSAADALLLQTLVHAIEKEVLSKQPHANAFYSRSSLRPSIEDVDESFSYEWWLLWPEFQARIWEFTEDHSFVVVTDLANYYDSIPLHSLRNTLASLGHFSETLLDFLFFMLEAFTWRPHYIPLTGVGLPQLNLDAPRLLAHVYLFPIDRELTAATGGEFVRWMDDIDFGVDSVHEGRVVLGKLEYAANSMGLRLNAGKSRIMSGKSAVQHFWIRENRQITVLTNLLNFRVGKAITTERVRRLVRKELLKFFRKERLGNWEKVVKRYYTFLGKLNDPFLVSHTPDFLRNNPALRDSTFRYYEKLGFNRRRFEQVITFLEDTQYNDDAALLSAVHLLTSWRVPRTGASRTRLVAYAHTLAAKSERTVIEVLAALWLLTKYGTSSEVGSFVRKTKSVWSKSEWAARQIAAASPRLNVEDRAWTETECAINGLLDALHIFNHLEFLAKLPRLDQQLRPYLLLVPNEGYAYPLSKVLIAVNLLSGALDETEKTLVSDFITKESRDLVYRELVNR